MKKIIVEKKSKELSDYDLRNMYTILINNLKNIFSDFKEKMDDKTIWENSIKKNDYSFILIYDNEVLVAYLEYYKNDNQYYLCEIEIDDQHKGDGKTFKKLIQTFSENIDLKLSIYCNINPENKKSLAVFNHIGLIKLGEKKHQIINEKLTKYVSNN